MLIPLRVKYDDGHEVEVTAKPKDIVSFERQYGESFVQFLAVRRYEWLCYLAWAPLHRQGLEKLPFDEFMTIIEDVESLDSAEVAVVEVAPFPPVPTDDSLPG